MTVEEWWNDFIQSPWNHKLVLQAVTGRKFDRFKSAKKTKWQGLPQYLRDQLESAFKENFRGNLVGLTRGEYDTGGTGKGSSPRGQTEA